MTRRVRIAAGAVLALKLFLIFAWGDRTPIFDEAGYLKTAAAVAAWLGGGDGTPAVLGRIAWHNPGYAGLVTAFGVLGDTTGLCVRIVQALAGVHTGWCVHTLLARRVAPSGALLGAMVVWLHPSMLFFGLALWPVALVTWGLAVATLAADDFVRSPDSRRRATALGWAIAPIPFFAPQALLLLPLVSGLVLRVRRRLLHLVLGPLAALWIPWALAASMALELPTPMDFAGRETLAIGNNPWVPPGRGSSFNDRDSLGLLRGHAGDICGDGHDAERVRCDARVYGALARRTALKDPVAAAARALIRVGEAWGTDTFLPRHLRDPRAFPTVPLGVGAVDGGLVFLHGALLIATLGALVNPRRRRDVAMFLVAAALPPHRQGPAVDLCAAQDWKSKPLSGKLSPEGASQAAAALLAR